MKSALAISLAITVGGTFAAPAASVNDRQLVPIIWSDEVQPSHPPESSKSPRTTLFAEEPELMKFPGVPNSPKSKPSVYSLSEKTGQDTHKVEPSKTEDGNTKAPRQLVVAPLTLEDLTERLPGLLDILEAEESEANKTDR